MGGWLTTIVGRVCIDMLRARRTRGGDDTASWRPEPIVSIDQGPGPEDQAVLADSVGLALLVVLDTLAPAERLAFVLHDMFGVPFDEIAPIVERSPDAARQLASRARRRVRGAPTESDADLATQREVVAAFLTASRAGDFDALLKVLDPDVIFRADAGDLTGLIRSPILGATEVARHAATTGPTFATRCHPAIVNGGAGLVIRAPQGPIGAVGFTIAHGKVASIDLVLDPDRLRDRGADTPNH